MTNAMEPLTRTPDIDPAVREKLPKLGDALLPEAHGMPAASQMAVGGDQLDVVLRSRPDLVPLLERGVAGRSFDDPMADFDALEADDPEAHAAVALAIVGGYYMHPTVHELIGYPGQAPLNAQQIGEREVEQEGLLDLLEASQRRGPVFRPTPEPGPGTT